MHCSVDSRDVSSGDRQKRLKPGSWLLLTVGLALAVIAGLYIFGITFTQFSFYDDEGFMMISVRGFLAGHSLYDQVFSVYGPCYYFYQWLFHTITALPVTHDVTRTLCAANWLLISFSLAFAGGVMARSTWVGFLIFMQATVHLTGLSREPGHPQELVGLLLACSVLLIGTRVKEKWVFAGLGAICAGLTLTKINVGAFFAWSLLLAFASATPRIRAHRLGSWLLLGIASLLPFLLMHAKLDQGWAIQFAGAVSVAIFTTGAIAFAYGQDYRISGRQWLQAGAAFVVVALLLVGFVIVKGSSVPALVTRLIIGPLDKAAGEFCVPMYAPGSLWSALASLGAAALWTRTRENSKFLWFTVGAKLVYGVVGAFVFLGDGKAHIGYLLPWLWLGLVQIPPNSLEPRQAFRRGLLCLVAAWQSLQAYPVAGTQVDLGSLLLVMVYALCLHDAIRAVLARPWAPIHLATFLRRATVLRILLILCFLDVFAFRWCWPNWLCERYRYSMPLGLSGARYLRLPARQVQEYRAISDYLREESDTFITYPGLNSLYFWSGKEPPTYLNFAELICLNKSQQVQVVTALCQFNRPLVVVDESSLMVNSSDGPLLNFIREQCVEIKRIGPYRVFKPRKAQSPANSASAHIVQR